MEQEEKKLQWVRVAKKLEQEFDLGNLPASSSTPRQCCTRPARGRAAGPGAGQTQLLINQLWQLRTMRVEKAVVACLWESATGLSRGKPLSRHGHSPASSSSRIIRHPSKKITFWWDEVSSQWQR